MTAVYKRELRSYLTSMVGYLFIFFILLLTGIYFSAYQLAAAYPKFEYTLSALTFVFLISVPILCGLRDLFPLTIFKLKYSVICASYLCP